MGPFICTISTWRRTQEMVSQCDMHLLGEDELGLEICATTLQWDFRSVEALKESCFLK